MDELREKIARAIYEDRNGNGAKPWSLQTKSHRAPYIVDAAAALRVIEGAGYDIVPQTDEGGHIIHRPRQGRG